MHFALAVAIAVSFWGARGVQVPCQPIPVSGADAQLPADRLPAEYGGYPVPMAAAPGCRILISRGGSSFRHNRDMAPWYCAYVVHEVGHLAGLGHTQAGLMTDGELFWEWIPYDCVHWKRYAEQHRIPLRR